MTCEQTRKYFPYLNNGLLYFNHAAVGPISLRVREKLHDYIYQRSETIVENYFETMPQVKSAKEKLARLLNTDQNLIAWSDNVSNSMNVVAQGIDWKAGDEIIINDIEFPANVYPFLNLEKNGVIIKKAKSENGKVDLPQIEKLVTPNTKLITISFVQFLSGYRADIKSIGEFCKQKDIIFVVDGIQGVGTVKINVEDSYIDFFAGGTQKWLMGLQGLSYFYISPKLFNKINLKYLGWTSVKNAWNFLDYQIDLLDSAERFQNGTNCRIGIIAIDESLSMFEEVGYENIEKNILENSEYLVQSLIEIGIDPILRNVQKKNLAGIVSFQHEKSEYIFTALKEQKFICSLRNNFIRLSPHFYNTKDDINYFVSKIAEIL
jgi:selenocysteine lyase/cysteine desulfurase